MIITEKRGYIIEQLIKRGMRLSVAKRNINECDEFFIDSLEMILKDGRI